jgi:hypothetical protein
MLVAIDFDHTISANEYAWLNVIDTMKQSGFQVIVVTYRKPDCDPHELNFLKKHVYDILFTGQRNKKQFCLERGYEVDVWVDDEPITVTHDYVDFKFQLP